MVYEQAKALKIVLESAGNHRWQSNKTYDPDYDRLELLRNFLKGL